jgi:hypothetical protein
VTDFIDCGLTNGESVHYVTCQQPSWFVWEKAYSADNNIDNFHDYLVFIDCYLPVFGFDDEVLKKRRKDLQRRGISVVTAGGIAGLHTATAKAFNITKKTIRSQKPPTGMTRSIRKPHRMIYDSVSALADASGIEQVRLFFRHVIPSERSYGMLTLIVESQRSDEVLLNSIKSIADVVCEVQNDKLKLIRK